jgi:hypothetical protein
MVIPLRSDGHSAAPFGASVGPEMRRRCRRFAGYDSRPEVLFRTGRERPWNRMPGLRPAVSNGAGGNCVDPADTGSGGRVVAPHEGSGITKK